MLGVSTMLALKVLSVTMGKLLEVNKKGCAGALPKVMLQLWTEPVSTAPTSCTKRFQVPLPVCPLLNAPINPCGRKVPVKGALPVTMDVVAD